MALMISQQLKVYIMQFNGLKKQCLHYPVRGFENQMGIYQFQMK
jgi:hypothetical protein